MENNNVNEVKKESKIKKFLKSEGLKNAVRIVTAVLTVANTVFLVWTCSSSVEAEVNADVQQEYDKMKGVDVGPTE